MDYPKKCCLAERCGQSYLVDLQSALGCSRKWELPGWLQLCFFNSLYLWAKTYADAGTWFKLGSAWGTCPPASSKFLLFLWVRETRRGIFAGHLQLYVCQLLFISWTPQKCQIRFDNLAYYFLIIVPRIEEHPLHLSAPNRSQVGWFTKHENNLPTAGTYTLKGENTHLACSHLATSSKGEILGISSCF